MLASIRKDINMNHALNFPSEFMNVGNIEARRTLPAQSKIIRTENPVDRHTAEWQKIFDSVKDTNPEAIKFADAAMRAKERKAQIESGRRKMVVLASAPPVGVSEIKSQCQARTMAGKKCTFKAVKGCYCKKHA
jgi:hypothetical protein